MNRIKDFIYDKNDLLVALVIVVLAAFLIVSRVDVIMAYPSTIELEMDNAAGDRIAQENPKNDLTKPSGGADGDSDEADGHNSDEAPDAQSPENANTSEKTEKQPKDNQEESNTGEGAVSVYIDYGSTAGQIAQLLLDSGVIDSKENFYDVLSSTGADTRLQAGTFSIPANSSIEEVIRIITQ